MAIYAEFFRHANFGGYTESFTLENNWRYRWIKFGSQLGNEISSMRSNAYGGTHGNVYGFTGKDFLGSYASLNMSEGWTCWWSNVGGQLNDDIESAIMVNRNKSELVIELEALISGPFKTQFDEEISGTPVSRRGEPKIYSVFWPSFDSTKKFVRLEQNLRVEKSWWPDYDARVRYDIYLYRTSSGGIGGYVNWTHTWVEGGIFSNDILDELHPQLVNGGSVLTQEFQSQLVLLSLLSGSIQALYLLPGREPPMPPPSSNFGHTGNAKENSTLVLVN